MLIIDFIIISAQLGYHVSVGSELVDRRQLQRKSRSDWIITIFSQDWL